MRLRTTAAVLGLTALTVLTLPGCSSSHRSPGHAAASLSSAERKNGTDTKPTAAVPLASGALSERLLDETDLGPGYSRKPESTSDRDDVTVTGCPALEKLGGDAAAGGSLDFPNKAKASFTYTGSSDSEISEELYSDTEAQASQRTRQIFDAMASCPTYQVVVGSTPIDMGTQKVAAPRLGDEQWSQLLTFTISGSTTVVKQTAVRTGTTVVVLAGSPGLVDTHLDKALKKAQTAR
ncbi:hypothetical protein [Streptomyces sp. UNOB3_S3]|uniref:hypothetical protein n=1 Tax=Streptomyces sp. UNOB3_S3 TaxID=2871682 RepID=UPI001E564643|nr:hypothetical protein [Streptomyces sp. UNOB3_S3]MCC3775862.1 hypothetical protein [Streptomyces sp. UNOB3_S3]